MANSKIVIKNYNGTSYDELYPKTTADQVTTDSSKQFVTQSEKDSWNNKAPAHTHPYEPANSNIQTHISSAHAPSNAQANIQSDWNAASGDSFIKNKPTLGSVAAKDYGTSSGQVPVLNADGKLDEGILPAIAITDTFVVASESAMLALTAQTGDVAIRSDLGKSFILQVNAPTVLSNWVELKATNVFPVTSVAGKTGAVSLVKGDVGLGSVDNTADSAKNVLSATKLTTARTINGVSFDGTTSITIADGTKVAPTGTIVANRVAIFSDTTGKVIKDSGYTIASSVPSGAIFTDTVYTHPNDANTRHVTDTEKATWNNKVDKESGKGLSTNDFTNAYKTKLEGLKKIVTSSTEPSSPETNDIWYQIIS